MGMYIVYGVIALVVILVLRAFLNKPSKAKQEHEQRMKEIKQKYKGKYDEVRPLEKDRKKYY